MQPAQIAAGVLRHQSVPEAVRLVTARDSRISGEYISAALAVGLASARCQCVRRWYYPDACGHISCRRPRCRFGVLISASYHRRQTMALSSWPSADENFPTRLRLRLKLRRFGQVLLLQPGPLWAGSSDLRMRRMDISPTSCHLCRTVWKDGPTVMLDCTHGAASRSAPWAFEDAGARQRRASLRSRRHGRARSSRWGADP
jgi:phosphoglucosamine mutase